MKRPLILIAVGALVLSGCGAEVDSTDHAPAQVPAPSVSVTDSNAAAPDTADANTLTPDGWGPIRIGMTRAEVVAAAGDDANPNAVGGPEPDQCDQFRPLEAPAGMLVMLEQGRVTRITISRESEIKTDRGFGVGDSASTIKAAYGASAVVTPHKYVDAPAEYITVWATDADAEDARGIVYEIGNEGRVMHVHAGTRSIQYVEGCL